MSFTLPKDFVLIFYHNAKSGFFPSKQAAIFSQNSDRFSLLSRIDNRFQTSNNSFEFILYYPDVDEFCHWKQTENPILTDKTQPITFEDVNCSWHYLSHYPFNGLWKSTSINCFLDSGENNSFYYAVGMYHNDTNYPGLPGPKWEYNNETLWEEYLYMKVEDPTSLKYLYSVCSPYQSREILLHILFTAIMLG